MSEAAISYIKNVHWLPSPNRVELYLSSNVPDSSLIRSAFVFAHDNDGRFLLVHSKKGRLDIPGGRLNRNELVEDAARRELLEEAGCGLGALAPIGYKKIVTPQCADNKHVCYQQFFVAPIRSIAFRENHETERYELFDRSQIERIECIQFENNRFLFDRADALTRSQLAISHFEDQILGKSSAIR